MEARGVICVIGGGPAGLMAADTAAQAGQDVMICDAMPSVGRKFLLAGRGGLNLTHSEPLPRFVQRYGARSALFQPLIEEFGPVQLRAWAASLGIETFEGSSGRIFPKEFKAAPLLRAWVKDLRDRGVQFHPRHRWIGVAEDGGLRFATPQGERWLAADATILALGGASWPHLGSDGSWVSLLTEWGCPIAPLKPANCGFHASWSPYLAPHFGKPLKSIALTFGPRRVKGEIVLTDYGLEGGALYALSGSIRDALERDGSAPVSLDFRPDQDVSRLIQRLHAPRGHQSLSSWLKKTLHLPAEATALLREICDPAELAVEERLAERVKALPIPLTGTRPLAEAISTAGGLRFEALDEQLMIRDRPGFFAAGEMLDWEAPTGGYLLTGCFASGRRAGQGASRWVAAKA